MPISFCPADNINNILRSIKEGLFFGAVQFAAENDSEWEGYRVVLTFPELYEPLGGVVGMSIVVVKEE